MDDSGNLIAGQWEMAIGKVVVPASLLGEIKIDYAEGELEADTQAGKRKQPSGKADTAEVSFTMFLPSMDALKVIFANAYNEGKAGSKGSLVFGKSGATAGEALPVNIHREGDETDDNDIHIYSGVVKMAFNPTLSTSDFLQIETTIYANATPKGRIRVGTGDTTKAKTVYDPATLTTKEVVAR